MFLQKFRSEPDGWNCLSDFRRAMRAADTLIKLDFTLAFLRSVEQIHPADASALELITDTALVMFNGKNSHEFVQYFSNVVTHRSKKGQNITHEHNINLLSMCREASSVLTQRDALTPTWI